MSRLAKAGVVLVAGSLMIAALWSYPGSATARAPKPASDPQPAKTVKPTSDSQQTGSKGFEERAPKRTVTVYRGGRRVLRALAAV